MILDAFKHIISSLLSASIWDWLTGKWRKRLPYAKKPAKQKKLVEEHKGLVGTAHIVSLIGILTGPVLYVGGFLPSNDWRGLGLSFFLMAALPLLVIACGIFLGGTACVRTAFAAYAVTQKMRVRLLLTMLIVMVIGGLWISIASRPGEKPERKPAPVPRTTR